MLPDIFVDLLAPLPPGSILEDGIAYRPGDIDVVWVAGYGFPDFRGGPMHMAESIGREITIQRLSHYVSARGNIDGYWTPALPLQP